MLQINRNKFMKIDNRIQDIINAFIDTVDAQFPGLFIDYYLCGSQMDQTANDNSDIDLILVTEKSVAKEVEDAYGEIYKTFNRNNSLQIGAMVHELTDLKNLMAYEKSALHLKGENCFRNIPLYDIDSTIKQYIFGSLKFIGMFLRDRNSELHLPVALPDPEAETEFYGYRFPDESFGPCCKRIVSAIARFCGALIALKWNKHPVSKRESIKVFAQLSSSRFVHWVVEVTELMSKEWNYLLPVNIEDKARFLEILRTFNDFENYFLEQVTPYINSCLEDDNGKEWVKECNTLVTFPNKSGEMD